MTELKNSIGEVKDILNNKTTTEEPQHYIMSIINIDNEDYLYVEGNTFKRMALIYFYIVLGMENFTNLEMIEKQEYLMLLDSQEIESIFLNYNERTNLNLKSMEDLSLKDAIQPILNYLESSLEDEE